MYDDQQLMDHDYIMDRIDKQYFIDRRGRIHISTKEICTQKLCQCIMK